MFKPTMLHDNSIDINKRQYTMRIGSHVPENAVNLAYYYNKKMDTNSNVLIAQGNKNILDHKFVQKWITKEGLQTDDPSQFPVTIPYADEDGYSGYIDRRFINWTKVTHIEKQTRSDSGTKENLDSDFALPIDRKFFTVSPYAGNEFLMNVEFDPIEYIDVVKPGIALRECVSEISYDDQPSPNAYFPDTVDYNKDGFIGSLHKNGPPIIDYKFTNSGAGKKQTKVVNFDGKDKPPKTLNQNGVLWTLANWTNDTHVGEPVSIRLSCNKNPQATQEYKDPVTGETMTLKLKAGSLSSSTSAPIVSNYKSYGISRYLGQSSTGTYGYTGSSQYGNWSDPYPVLMSSMYGHNIDRIKDSIFGNDQETGISIQPNKAVTVSYVDDGKTITKFISRFEYDAGVASKYQSGTQYGMLWLDNYFASSASHNKLPPDGYSEAEDDADQFGGGGLPVGESLTRGVYPCAGQYAKNTIAFYKWSVTKTVTGYTAIYEGKHADTYGTTATYEAYGLGETITTYKVTQRYNGVLSKPDNKIIPMPSKWNANIDYKGTLKYLWYNYTGSAFYDGSVIKQNAIGNGNPMGTNQITMYPDTTGVLYDINGNKEVESEFMYITNIFKDNIPLFYRCKLKYKIFNNKQIDINDLTENHSVILLNSTMKPLNKNKYKYAVQLVPSDPTGTDISKKFLYDVYVYTSFLVTDNFKVFCSYTGYDNRAGLDIFRRIKSDIVEPINTAPYFELNSDYTLTNINKKQRTNYITVSKTNIIDDTRNKVYFRYKVKTTDNIYCSNYINAYVINNEYAFSNELRYFVDRNYIVSPIDNGLHMTSFEILKRDCQSNLLDIHGNYDNEKLKELSNKIFVVEIEDIYKDTVNIFTPPDGSGVVSAETTIDTGFDDGKGNYTKMPLMPNRFIAKNNKILPAFQIMCTDARYIEILQPRENGSLDNWYPRIQFGHFTQVRMISNIKTKYVYSMPEFDNQEYSSIYGKPYVDICKENVQVAGPNIIKIQKTPLYVKVDDNNVPINLKIYKTDVTGYTKYFDIKNWNIDGTIELCDVINQNDSFLVDYTYEEQSVIYRGFYDKAGNYIDLDVNPNMYHTFLDTRYIPYERRPVYDLFNTIIYFFMKPSLILQEQSDKTFKETYSGETSLYHKFDDIKPNSPFDILVGSIHMRNTTSLKSTVVIDSRTRGGGVIEGMSDNIRRSLEPESDYYFDIGYWDGKPYTENAVVLIRLDKRILKYNGGRFTQQDVEEKINKWITAGVIPIIEYVTTYSDNELPQSSMTTEKEYENTFDYTPTLFVE